MSLEHHLDRLDLKIDYNRKRRGSVCITPGKLEPLASTNQIHTYEKSEQLRSRMSDILAKNFLFSGLPQELLQQTIDRMWLTKKKIGELISQENEPADQFYFFEDGNDDSKLPTGIVSASDKFILAEIARIQPDSRIWALDGYTYRSLLWANNKSKIEHNEKILSRLPFFSGKTLFSFILIFYLVLAKSSFSKLVDAVESQSFEEGETILEKGDTLDRFYVVDTVRMRLFENVESFRDS